MRFSIFAALLLSVLPYTAHAVDDAHVFDIDLYEKTPLLSKLLDDYQEDTSQYSWHYQFRWNMPVQFDSDFGNIINNFGVNEKRLENADEERILQMLQRLPKEMYPYIGPVLHKVRGLSGKVLNLPGIKETKNKFPTRIARALQDIPYLEFASPSLYIFLMPEMWGESSVEYPKIEIKSQQNPHKIRINPALIAAVEEKVPATKFMLDAPAEQPLLQSRHFNPDLNTPLSTSDVRAFIDSIGGLDEFLHQNKNEQLMIGIIPLMRYYDGKNGEKKIVGYFKAAVNPCQTIVRKVQWLGKYAEFQKAIGSYGFGLDDWAYTCEKTLKAYRIYKTSVKHVGFLNSIRKGLYEKMLRQYKLTPQEREMLHYQALAYVELYTAPKENIDAVRPYAAELQKKLIKLGNQYGGTPLVMP